MPKLGDKWDTEECWQRALYLRSSIMWLFRQEIVALEFGKLKWLGRILANAYDNADALAGSCSTDEEAFGRCVDLLVNYIEQRIEQVGPDAELTRLLGLASGAQPSDPIRKVFSDLRRNARSIYRSAPSRKVQLNRRWRSDHPLGSIRPGEYPDPYHLSAETKVHSASCSVELAVHLEEFGIPSFLAIPGLLAHELFCHAYSQEERSDRHSIWAEGVMDWAAIFFFERWCLRSGWPYPAVSNRREDLWASRRLKEPQRFIGHDIAKTLVQWFYLRVPAISGHEMAQVATARLFIEVNSSMAFLRAKDNLASRMANITTDPVLQDACRRWQDGEGDAVKEMLG